MNIMAQHYVLLHVVRMLTLQKVKIVSISRHAKASELLMEELNMYTICCNHYGPDIF